jgi:hypothetical protein
MKKIYLETARQKVTTGLDRHPLVIARSVAVIPQDVNTTHEDRGAP